MRDSNIDVAKGFAIFLVVMGHVLNFCFYGDNATNSFCYKVIYSFHMPLFMFLSGMVIKDSCLTLRSVYVDLKKRFRKLVVPMIGIGLVYAYLFDHNYMGFFNEYNKLGYWYLMSLFSLYIIYRIAFGAIRKLHVDTLNKEICFWILIYFLFLCVIKVIPGRLSNAFCLGQACRFFPYFAMGYIIGKFKLKDIIFSSNVVFSCSLVLYLLSIALDKYTNNSLLVYRVYEIPQSTSAILIVTNLIWGTTIENRIIKQFEMWGGQVYGYLCIPLFCLFLVFISMFNLLFSKHLKFCARIGCGNHIFCYSRIYSCWNRNNSSSFCYFG